jgi:hypothetical protein
MHAYCSTIHNSQGLETAQMPTTDEWTKKIWYINTVKYYLAIKNEIMLFAGKWIKLENMLSEVNQTQNVRDYMFSLICGC